MGNLAIFGFGSGGWGLALLQGATMTLLVSACGLITVSYTHLTLPTILLV